ncbi:conjugal transfer protein TraN [Novosphingobium profundi]|uniref:conjugal transfer protein TraN n=1 Tax=Novosphingobium profundi TaxID=1774954 RepID=UPI001BDAF441|nr:conjugal transfer protein TraN [Novosphingobium profundi]MBT0667381.1 conjugal transfer protein TraN [Novosphingobium profundi]
MIRPARSIARHPFPSRGVALALALAGFLGHPASASAQQLCAADLNANGDAADEGEQASCLSTLSGAWLCPIEEVDCVADARGQYACPAGAPYACLQRTANAVPSCSPHLCADLATSPIVEEPPLEDPGREADGGIDADGNCMGHIEIFSGRGLRCRPAGLSTTFSDCCKDKGEIVKDGMGASISSVGTKVAVAKGVFTGMRAAYTAFKAGASASQAANAGANALIIGLDPTSLAVSLAINFMMEFLFAGCDQQDMGAAMLRASGMCHEIGSYCTSSFLGICLQKARGSCCFNTKLGRILQEQGRPQLQAFNGNLWGTPKNPMCRGFTPEEFQALDFSKIDLTEYYAEIETRTQSDIQIDMGERVDAYLKAVNP